ncbi:hypothetical protein niasHT_017651 [Heterodera trifolii]|uniref:Caspase family p20 domain-containing protein n=1 Tax=Heterodera trifolii TaxID=157864 RepID=A0ABD2L8H8_9BILA
MQVYIATLRHRVAKPSSSTNSDLGTVRTRMVQTPISRTWKNCSDRAITLTTQTTMRPLTNERIMSTIRQFACFGDQAETDSHGEQDVVLGIDGVGINMHEFASEMNATGCPQLAGKPKLKKWNWVYIRAKERHMANHQDHVRIAHLHGSDRRTITHTSQLMRISSLPAAHGARIRLLSKCSAQDLICAVHLQSVFSKGV